MFSLEGSPICTVTFEMKKIERRRTRSTPEVHTRRVVVFFTNPTLSIICVAACFQGSYAPMEKLMVSAILANHQVTVAIVRFVFVNMMNDYFRRKRLSKCVRGNGNMLRNIAISRSVRMAWKMKGYIAIADSPSTFPLAIVLSPVAVPTDKFARLSLNRSVFIVIVQIETCVLFTATLTKCKVIHDRTPSR